MSHSDAEKIHLFVNEIFERINDILFVVNNTADSEIKKNTQVVLGNVIAALDIDLLEPIYKRFPDLRPPEMEELKN